MVLAGDVTHRHPNDTTRNHDSKDKNYLNNNQQDNTSDNRKKDHMYMKVYKPQFFK